MNTTYLLKIDGRTTTTPSLEEAKGFANMCVKKATVTEVESGLEVYTVEKFTDSKPKFAKRR